MTSPDNNPPNEENRKYPRLRKDVTVQFKLANSQDAYFEAMSENISMDGVLIEMINVDQSFIKGNFVEIALQGPPASVPVKVLGQIAWVNQMRFSYKIKMGIKILSLVDGSDEQMRRLLK